MLIVKIVLQVFLCIFVYASSEEHFFSEEPLWTDVHLSYPSNRSAKIGYRVYLAC